MSGDHHHSVTPSDVESTLREALRAAGMRITGTRLALLRLMGQFRAPASAQQLFDSLCAARRSGSLRAAGGGRPDRVTVYRTLNSLVEAGLAHKVDPGDRVFRFSLTDHARCEGEKHVHEHPHFVCDSCGTVECLEDERVVIKRRPSAMGAKSRGSTAADRRRVRQEGVVLHGTCGECSEQPASPGRRTGE
ncbi:MAG TPA: Fur family transcriptional regulator [Phycisphaerales bacterium]|nr:Fur family transcriptional regulator [Phycisphaerales bacterium]